MSETEDTTTPSKTHQAGSTPFGPNGTPSADVENQTAGGGATGFGVLGIVRRWRREDVLKKAYLALRGLALLFSLLAFLIMASNKHADWKKFDRFEEYRYRLRNFLLLFSIGTEFCLLILMVFFFFFWGCE